MNDRMDFLIGLDHHQKPFNEEQLFWKRNEQGELVFKPPTSHADAEDDRDLEDLLIDKALEQSSPAVTGWLDVIRKQLQQWQQQGLSMEEARDRLPELYDQLNDESFATALMQMSMLGDLIGRTHVMEEADYMSEQRADDRRIWVKNPEVKYGGYWRRQKDAKTPKQVSPFVSQQEFSELVDVEDERFRRGQGDTTFVENASGERKLLKRFETKQGMYREGIQEVVCAEIGINAGVKLNRSRLIPAKIQGPLKPSRLEIGTLHDLVPGKNLGYNERGRNLTIQLSKLHDNNDAIINAVQHKDLARILAFDIFTGNRDRHNNNLFYDPRKGYYGIDQGYCYLEPGLTQRVAQDLQEMPDESLAMLAEDEATRKNLTILNTTLQTLIQDNPTETITARMTKYSEAALGNTEMYHQTELLQPTNRDVMFLKDTHRIVADNHRHAERVVKRLDQFLK